MAAVDDAARSVDMGRRATLEEHVAARVAGDDT